MSFKNPEFIIFIPLFIFFLWLKLKQKPPAIKYSLGYFLKENFSENKIKKYFFIFLRLATVIFLSVALARPVKGLKERSVNKPAVDIMLVMDVSTSMKAIDFDPLNRMEAAVSAAKEFVKSRRTDRFGIVVFEGAPVLQCPLTLDTGAVLRFLEGVEAGMVGINGTAIGSGMALGLKYLEKADSPGRVMILLTDGANNMGDVEPEAAADIAAALDIKVYTIGCGKPGPARVPVEDPVFGKRFVTIPDEIDEEVLQLIAQKTGGRYYRADSRKEFSRIYSEIDSMEKTDVEITEFYEFEDKYRLFLLAGLVLLLIELAVKTFSRGMNL
ncbi:MAG: VWA domain-containing protein [Elusimicrobiota bacterium]|nr:VWA domain-containing protein [Elusimicrobiota bacterium]